MERTLVSFTLENFITVGLIAAFWFVLLVGGFTIWQKAGSGSVATAGGSASLPKS